MGRTGIYACGESVSRRNSLESVALFSLKQEAPASIGGSTFTNNLIISRYKKGLPHSDSPFFYVNRRNRRYNSSGICGILYASPIMHSVYTLYQAGRPKALLTARYRPSGGARPFPEQTAAAGGPLRAEGFPKRRCRLESVAA